MKIIYTTLATLIIITSVIHSKSAFVSQIPNGNKYSCTTCHPAGNYGQLNNFGQTSKSHLSAGKINWGESMALLDSDGDGFTNGTELQDPDGNWKQGQPAPGELNLVTNPGDPNSFPNENYVEDFSKVSGMRIYGIYPNPIIEKTNVDISLSVDGYLKFELFNYAGLLICVLQEGFYKSGSYTINLYPLSFLNSGEYFLKVSFNVHSSLEKIFITK